METSVMSERLLQFIWQFQYFNKGELRTTANEPVRVLFPGQPNKDQGPDFLNARIKIGDTIWAGTVELHISSADWKRHHHQSDPNYRNVVLHVVWEANSKRSGIPMLELKGRISKLLIDQYEEWMHSASFVPCEKNISSVNRITWESWKDRLLVERLMKKAANVEILLSQNKFHWDETFWWLLARNFGVRVNADTFEAIARSIPTSILAKHKHNQLQIESLLFGQAGLLGKNFRDHYPRSLYKEYRYLSKLHQLNPMHLPLYLLRMRPGSFPCIRLSQLSALICQTEHLFRTVIESSSLAVIRKLFNVSVGGYWISHYTFNVKSSKREKSTGASMIDNIIVNTVVPILFTYGKYRGEQEYKDRATQWLLETKAESNSIIAGFGKIGVAAQNAFDSQALIHLKSQYCDQKRCLECTIGNALLKGG